MRRTYSLRSWVAGAAVLSLALTALVGCTRPGGGTGGGGGNQDAALCHTTSTAGAPTTGYWAKGPEATTKTVISDHTYFYPTNLAGSKHPVVLWGNGTGVTPNCYPVLLTHWAQYGFIVAAANTTNSGSGREMLAGLDYLTTANSNPASPFYGAVDLANVATSGHSQGGAGSIAAGRDPRVKTIMPIEGAGGTPAANNHITALIFAGTADTLVGTTGPKGFYNAAPFPAAYAEAAGASHFTVNNAPFRPASTAWLLWQLKGDLTARGQFLGANCGLCNNPSWTSYMTNAKLKAL